MSVNMVDTIRALFTYITALLVAVGGLFAIATQPLMPDTKTIVGAFVGSALTFLFGQEVSTRTARQSAAATLAATPTNGNAH